MAQSGFNGFGWQAVAQNRTRDFHFSLGMKAQGGMREKIKAHKDLLAERDQSLTEARERLVCRVRDVASATRPLAQSAEGKTKRTDGGGVADE